MFLDDVEPFPKEKWPAKERDFSNWIKVADTIYNTENPAQVLRILQLELMSLRRQYVIDRVYSRFSAIRAKDEKTNPHEFFSDLDPVWGDKEEVDKALNNWHTMRAHLNKEYKPTSHIKSLLYREYRNRKRPYMMKRLYGKFNMQRMYEEKKEMMRWKLKSK